MNYMNNDTLLWLQQWYLRYCYDDFFGPYRVKIDTIGNPGWCLSIDLSGTELVSKAFTDIKVERSEDDWFHCFIRDGRFEGPCGPANLIDVLAAFREWVERVDLTIV